MIALVFSYTNNRDRLDGPRWFKLCLLMAVMAIRIGIVAEATDTCYGAEANDDSAPAISAFVARLKQLQNIQVKFDLNINKTPPPEAAGFAMRTPKGQIVSLKPAELSYHCQMHYLNGYAKFDMDPTEAMMAAGKQTGDDVVHITRIFTSDRVEILTLHSNDPRPIGIIQDHADFSEDSFIEVALGLRLFNSTNWLTADEIRRGKVTIEVSGNSELEVRDSLGYFHRWSIDLGHGASPMSYSVATPLRKEFVRYEFSDFDDSARLRLPKKLVMTRKTLSVGPEGNDSNSAVIEIDTANIKEIKVGDPGNKPDGYQMIWPKGTGVLDDRIGVTFRPVPYERKLTDRDIYQRILDNSTRPATSPSPQK